MSASSLLHQVDAFAAPLTPLFDRFRSSCPADLESIQQFDPTLVKDHDEEHIWAAVYRSNNNLPSVLVKDEFWDAMRSATSFVSNNNSAPNNSIETLPVSPKPVAVARLRPSPDFDKVWVMDCMQSVFKKENLDETCDGGSEHNEAISVAIDALLQYYLSTTALFEGAIRTKATLFSAPLLEDRGFVPVTNLSKDFCSHVSSLDTCLARYADRSILANTSPASRTCALEIVSLLGRLDRTRDLQQAQQRQQAKDDNTEEVDPWGRDQEIHLVE